MLEAQIQGIKRAGCCPSPPCTPEQVKSARIVKGELGEPSPMAALARSETGQLNLVTEWTAALWQSDEKPAHHLCALEFQRDVLSQASIAPSFLPMSPNNSSEKRHPDTDTPVEY